MKKTFSRYLIATLFLLLAVPVVSHAYIGPGAGFAFVSSFFVFFAAILMSLVILITFPIRMLWRAFFKKNPYKNAVQDKVVILGLDGLDPVLAKRFMDEGMLPNMKKLADEGHFSPLRTTFPSISPVAWSSFATGSNPARHNIFDFLSRDPNTYLPDLSSVRISTGKRTLKLGPIEIPMGSKPVIEGFQRSRTFWSLLGETGINTQVLRVPITFPPEKYSGMLLSAMCVPDLRGTQGTFSLYTTDKQRVADATGGTFMLFDKDPKDENILTGNILGPELGDDTSSSLSGGELGDSVKTDIDNSLKIPFTLRLKDKETATLEVGKEKLTLKKGEYTPWIHLEFKLGFNKSVRGIALMMLTRTEPQVELYVTPIHLDPAKPAFPISTPTSFSMYLSKLLGPFATLGLAEDTWALEDEAIDDDAFLKQVYIIHEEREKMLFNAVKKMRKGLVVCVVDATDRIQHMFWRYREDGRPDARDAAADRHREAIEDLYRRMDDLIGRLRKEMSDDTLFFVMSDHGFKPFNVGFQVNTWLRENGYLHLKPGAEESADWYHQVDWSRTKAYGFGLGGLYINLKDRESQGIVEPGEEYQKLKAELVEKMSGLVDPSTGKVAITEVFDTETFYRGPYKKNSPDLLVGYGIGYRAAWTSVTGAVKGPVFQPNEKAWGGDHCIDPRLVPGVIFSNRKIATEHPRILDLGPTVLQQFGVEIPGYMDGKPLELASTAPVKKKAGK